MEETESLASYLKTQTPTTIITPENQETILAERGAGDFTASTSSTSAPGCRCYLKVDNVVSNVQSWFGWFIVDVTHGTGGLTNILEYEGANGSTWFNGSSTLPLPTPFHELSYDIGSGAESNGLHMFYVGPGADDVADDESFVLFASYECRWPKFKLSGYPSGQFWIKEGTLRFDWADGEVIAAGLNSVRRYFVDLDCPWELSDQENTGS